MIKISKLKLNPGNPRKIVEAKMDALKKSIQDFENMMALRPIVVDEDYTVLGGNMRLQALKQLGYKEIPDEWVKVAEGLTEVEKKEFVIKDNVGFGEWDWDILANEWDVEQLADWGLDIPDWGTQAEAHEDDYEIPDEIQTDIVPGDLIEIGEHRLLCGDSVNADDVQKLLRGKEPYLMVTDPPYGVEYDANWRNEADRANGRPIGVRATMKVNNDENADWSIAWALSPAKVVYCWHAGKYASIVQNSLESANFTIRCQVVWVKSNFAISRGDYHWKHEPCWYAVKKGSKGNWAGDRKQTTVWEIQKPMKSETGHSTQKPVECMSKPIGNHDGDVYDPFIGSGTTMVAAHQLGRKCYGMEIDPKYCQVIIDRMLKLDPGVEVKINGKEYVRKEERTTTDATQ